MDSALVSVVTPSLNQGRFIERTILSVHQQGYPSVEHLVVDGGSTDGTVELLKKYSEIVRWTSEPDQGQSDAINKGFRRAKGEILAFLNADDTYLPNTLSTVVEYLSRNPHCVLVYGCSQAIGEHDEVLEVKCSKDFDLRLLTERNYILQSAVFFRREVLETVGELDVSLHYVMDYEFWLRVGTSYSSGVRYVPRLLSNYRVHPGAKSVRGVNALLGETVQVVDRYFARHDLPDEVARVCARCRSRAFYGIGERYYEHLSLLEARRLFGDAIKTDVGILWDTDIVALLAKSWLGERLLRALRERRGGGRC